MTPRGLDDRLGSWLAPGCRFISRLSPSVSQGTTAAQWNAAFFDHTSGVKSIKNYFEAASYGKFTIDPANQTQGTANDGVIVLTLNYAHPNTGGNLGDANSQIVKNALIAADPYINYRTYDPRWQWKDQLYRASLGCCYVWSRRRIGGSSYACAPSVWAHEYGLYGTVPPPTLDGVIVAGYDYSGTYVQIGEWTGDPLGCGGGQGYMAQIGTPAL